MEPSTLVLLFSLCLSLVTSEDFALTIVHTNDIHARFQMTTSRGGVCKDPTGTKCYGGTARRATQIKKARAENKHVLVLDAGDQFQGSPWFYTYKGAAASYFLNKLKYDAMCLGNHEFDNGLEGLRKFFNNATIPLICSNLIRDDQVPDFISSRLQKHIVKEVDGRKIGIIGYIIEEVPTLSKTENLHFESEEAGISKEIKLLKEQSVDIIIAVGHAGLETDLKLAKSLADVDVFVGGHSHSLLYNGENKNDEVAGVYPMVTTHADGRRNLVVQAGSTGKYVGLLKVNFDEKGDVKDWSGNPVLMDSTIEQDPDIKADLDNMNKGVSEEFDKVVGTSEMDFDTSNSICRIKECEMANMYADAMMEYSKKNDAWEVDMALVNGGSFRASLSKGDITYGEAISVFPFGNDIVIVPMTGSQIKEAFEHSSSDFNIETDRSGKFLQVSGIKVEYDFTKGDGDRVKCLKVRNKKTGKFEEIDHQKSYGVMIPSYLAGGGDGYTVFNSIQDLIINIDVLDVNVFLDYTKNHSPISACIEGRITGMETFPGWSALFPDQEAHRCSGAGRLGVLALQVAVPLMTVF